MTAGVMSRETTSALKCLVCGQRWAQVERSVGRDHMQAAHGIRYVRLERVKQKGSLSEAEKRERAKAAVRKYKQVGEGRLLPSYYAEPQH